MGHHRKSGNFNLQNIHKNFFVFRPFYFSKRAQINTVTPTTARGKFDQYEQFQNYDINPLTIQYWPQHFRQQ